ncbi:MAG: hypothetical protein EXR43_00215 [Dehalococcoidia bacterium]|nr:hypothetical protein [Dehalococcoidia bacterium]
MTNPRSMRYSMDEVLSGILATFERDTSTDYTQRLGEAFKGLSQQAPLFAPFGAIAEEGDFSAIVEKALGSLVVTGQLKRKAAHYELTAAGRARCVSSKRTLLNASDLKDLEAGARYFEEHCSA